jgi:uncharacterized protein (TIGR03067 family)
MNWLPALGLALVVGAPIPKEAPKKAEAPSIAGEWACIKFVAGGQEFPRDMLPTVIFEFTSDGKFRVREGDMLTDGTYSADETKNPAEIEYGTDKVAKRNKGIYKVEKDTLTFCFAEGGGERPTKFESPAGKRVLLMTFSRVQKKKD